MTPDLGNAIVAGIPIMFVVIGLVQWVKEKLEWSGKGVEVFAIALGFALGFAYQVYLALQAGEIVWDFVFIFTAVIYGLALGLGATGLYKTYKEE